MTASLPARAVDPLAVPEEQWRPVWQYARRLGIPLMVEHCRRMVADGWTQPVTEAVVSAVARWVVEAGTVYVQRAAVEWPDAAEMRRDVRAALLMVAYRVSRVPVPVGCRWLVTLFGSEDPAIAGALRDGDTGGMTTLAHKWAPVGDLGPLVGCRTVG